jgi:subtilisin
MPRRRKEAAGAAGGPVPEASLGNGAGDGMGVETTGRFIVVFKEGAADDAAVVRSTLSDAGLRDVTGSADYESGAISADDLAPKANLYFHKLGIAVVSGDDAVQALAAAASDAASPILAIEPEYVAYLSVPPALGGLSLDYLRGYRDALDRIYDEAVSGAAVMPDRMELEGLAMAFQDTGQFTWGLQATAVSTSQRGGHGMKVAVLDTGLDFNHPDFRGRAITSESFVAGVTADDVHGHGTHCIGTACGPQRPASGVRRYGVAYGAQIFVGKVFNNNQPRPSAPTSSVVAGIEWAITSGCQIASLSLGAPIDQKIMQYEVPMQRALNAGTLVVAAAGNNADRPAFAGFVEPPANADAAMAVGAIDRQFRIARFSARSSQLTGVGGIVNIAAPGVSVFSSVPVARGLHDSFNGTSMAAPHVAGIAALWSEVTGLTGAALWNRIVQSIRPLGIPSTDVGTGLVQAPQ